MKNLIVLLSLFTFSLDLLAGTKILFIGDSLTEGYGVDKNKSYPSLIAQKLKKEGKAVEIINGSVSGSTTASAISRYRWFSKAKPQIVLIALGGNDGMRGIKPKASKNNLERVILKIKSDGIKVILVGMKAPPNYGSKFTKEFESIYQDLAKKHKLILVPFLLDKIAGEASLNQGDGIHPNEKGHLIMSQTIYKYLGPLL